MGTTRLFCLERNRGGAARGGAIRDPQAKGIKNGSRLELGGHGLRNFNFADGYVLMSYSASLTVECWPDTYMPFTFYYLLMLLCIEAPQAS